MSKGTLKRRITQAHDDMCAALVREIAAHMHEVAAAVVKLATVDEARGWFLDEPNALQPLFARLPPELGIRDDELSQRLDNTGCEYDAEVVFEPIFQALRQVIWDAGEDAVEAMNEEYRRRTGRISADASAA